MMNYKGFIGVVEYDDEAHIFSGEVINTRTVITFQGTTVDEIENEFHASVDDYLEWCKEDGTGKTLFRKIQCSPFSPVS